MKSIQMIKCVCVRIAGAHELMDVHGRDHGCPSEEVCFPVALAMGKNLCRPLRNKARGLGFPLGNPAAGFQPYMSECVCVCVLLACPNHLNHDGVILASVIR